MFHLPETVPYKTDRLPEVTTEQTIAEACHETCCCCEDGSAPENALLPSVRWFVHLGYSLSHREKR